MAKIVFMGTPAFAVPSLRALLAAQTVVGVVTQPDRPAGRGQRLQASPVKAVAEAAGIPVYQPPSLRKPATIVPLQVWEPEVIVVVAFGQILRPHVLNLPPHGCLNVHASLLPRWRGAAPIQHAILAGDEVSGVSLMQLDEGMDTGPVYVRAPLPLWPDETAASLHDRLAELGAELLAAHLDDILAGRLAAQPQDDALATYAPMIKKEAGHIDWRRDAVELDRHVRAMTPWPGAYTTWQGAHLKILAARPLREGLPAGAPGRVVAAGSEVIALASAGGLALDALQLAGKRAMSAHEFVLGRPDFIGGVLGMAEPRA